MFNGIQSRIDKCNLRPVQVAYTDRPHTDENFLVKMFKTLCDAVIISYKLVAY